jgi:DNA-binding LytR/AlgR family response regulator
MDWSSGSEMNSNAPYDDWSGGRKDLDPGPTESQEEPQLDFVPRGHGPAKHLLLKRGRTAFFLAADSIRWIQADGNFVRLHVAGESHRTRSRISALCRRLDPQQFFRVHRSAIVNVDFIAELRARSHSDYEVLLKDGTVLKVSRSFWRDVQRLGMSFRVAERA